MNFHSDVVEKAIPERSALVALGSDGSREQLSFGQIAAESARFAGNLLSRGVSRGDVVMTVVGNRPEWVLAMLACFRIGAVALPCTEQLRASDLRVADGFGGAQSGGGRRAQRGHRRAGRLLR